MKCNCGNAIKSYEYMCRACFNREEGQKQATSTVSRGEENNRKKSPILRYSYEECNLWDENNRHWKLNHFMDKKMGNSYTPRDHVRKSGLFNFNEMTIGKIKIITFKDKNNYEFYIDRSDYKLMLINGVLAIESSKGYFHD